MTASIDHRSARLAVIGTALLYGAAHLAWYGSTPLGGFPVLDGREILELAKSIAAGSLPAEPLYRASLYPAVIALFIKLGISESFLPDVARLLNLLSHVVSATLIFELSRRVWADLRAGVLAGMLYALYPVAVDYAGDPLDITLATTLALAGTLAAWLAWERSSWRAALTSGVLLSLAALARPNFVACLPALLLWFCLLAWRDRAAVRLVFGAALGMVLILGNMAVINKIIGDDFRVLPWQGSHAIWDANGPGVTGLYYQHTISIPDLVPGSNPARAEAEILYCRDRPCQGDLDIHDFQSYWRGRFLGYLQEQPLAWLELMASKTWYLINNYEQYNNKTYWFHKDRAPWLRWNPLGWGLLLALAVGALWLPLQPQGRRMLVLLALAYACGVLIYFVSGRFRVPMVGWLCVLAGGWALLLHGRTTASRWSHGQLGAAVATALAVGGVAAVPVSETMRQSTVTEDWALVASASLAAGDWQQAETWARKVIGRNVKHTVAVALVCSARVYAWEQSPTDALPPRAWMEESLGFCAGGSVGSHRAAYNATFFLAGLCRHPEALEVWRQLQDSALVGELSRSAMVAVGARQEPSSVFDSGLASVMSADPASLKPGVRSMVNAIRGMHCANP